MERVEIDLSRETSISLWAELLGLPEEKHNQLYLPGFRSKLIEAMIEMDAEAELVTEEGHHIFRSSPEHARALISEALKRMEDA